jgi:Flp pilus assembly protein TadD
MEKGDYATALAAERRAIELYPNNHWAYLAVGEIYERMGRSADANDAYRKAISISPKDPACKKALANLLKQKMANNPLLMTR